MIHFQLSTEYIELSKLLKVTGLCAGGGVSKQAIAEGLVKVDGTVETRKGRKIREGRVIEYDGERIEVTGSTTASVSHVKNEIESPGA